MAWTAPRTWTTAETVTAAMMNTHVRDNTNYLYAPTLVAAAPGSNVTLVGNAWTDIVSLASITPAVAGTQIVFQVMARITSTAAGSPKVAVGVFEGGALIDSPGQTQMQGSGGATIPVADITYTFDCVQPSVTAAAHTYKIAGWKDANGAASAVATETLGAFTLACTQLTAIVGS